MKNILVDIPRTVLISSAAIVVSIVLYGILSLTLSTARDSAIVEHSSLTQQISNAEISLTQSFEDQRYVLENQARFEELMQSDRLVPHTRRAAIEELSRLANERGLTNLNYTFESAGEASPVAASSQPASGAYKVSLEQLEMNVGAPFDGPIYGFIHDLTNSFPGSAVVQSLTLARARQVTDLALRDVSEGRNSRLVEGTIQVSWRTAQAENAEEGESQ